MALKNMLHGVKVRDVMDRDCTTVDARTRLQSLVHEHLLPTRRRCLVVQKDGFLAGLITTTDVGRIGRDQWPVTTVEQAMKPLEQLHIVLPDAPVTQALEIMARENINQLPVVVDGHLEGALSRAHLLQVLQTRSELRV